MALNIKLQGLVLVIDMYVINLKFYDTLYNSSWFGLKVSDVLMVNAMAELDQNADQRIQNLSAPSNLEIV